MIAADRPDKSARRLLVVDGAGELHQRHRDELGEQLCSGDLVVANDAATLPASLTGVHVDSAQPIEIRLAGWLNASDPAGFVAVAFGEGDYRVQTESRGPPPELHAGDELRLGPLVADVLRLRDHSRLFDLRFRGGRGVVLAGLAAHGRPIQYAHVPEPLALWDVTTQLAARPFAFEAPSAGLALDWRTAARWRRRGIQLVTLTHAAGISSTGDLELDRRLPFDEPYFIPVVTADAVQRAKQRGRRVVAIGTTVVRALEAAATGTGELQAGAGVACGRIGPSTPIRIVDGILTGMHERGESHFELLRALAPDTLLERVEKVASRDGYRSHELGDSLLLH